MPESSRNLQKRYYQASFISSSSFILRRIGKNIAQAHYTSTFQFRVNTRYYVVFSISRTQFPCMRCPQKSKKAGRCSFKRVFWCACPCVCLPASRVTLSNMQIFHNVLILYHVIHAVTICQFVLAPPLYHYIRTSRHIPEVNLVRRKNSSRNPTKHQTHITHEQQSSGAGTISANHWCFVASCISLEHVHVHTATT